MHNMGRRWLALYLLLLQLSEQSLWQCRILQACSVLQAARAWLIYQNCLVSVPWLAKVIFAPLATGKWKGTNGQKIRKSWKVWRMEEAREADYEKGGHAKAKSVGLVRNKGQQVEVIRNESKLNKGECRVHWMHRKTACSLFLTLWPHFFWFFSQKMLFLNGFNLNRCSNLLYLL